MDSRADVELWRRKQFCLSPELNLRLLKRSASSLITVLTELYEALVG